MSGCQKDLETVQLYFSGTENTGNVRPKEMHSLIIFCWYIIHSALKLGEKVQLQEDLVYVYIKRQNQRSFDKNSNVVPVSPLQKVNHK